MDEFFLGGFFFSVMCFILLYFADPAVDKDVLGCHLMACSVLHAVVRSETDSAETTPLHTVCHLIVRL
jgi:hypothetical protein